MKLIQQITLTAVLCFGLFVGAMAGHYHGKAETLQKLIGDSITCEIKSDILPHGVLK